MVQCFSRFFPKRELKLRGSEYRIIHYPASYILVSLVGYRMHSRTNNQIISATEAPRNLTTLLGKYRHYIPRSMTPASILP